MPEADKKKKQFMQEKIIGRQKTRKSVMKRVIIFVATAVLFGVIVTATFVCLRPWMERKLGKGPKKETAQVTIPKDEPEAEPEIEPETMELETSVEEETKERETTTETELILEDKIQEVLVEYEFTMNDLQNIYSGLRKVVMQADKGIVKIRSVSQGVDWFDNLIEKEGQCAGALIAKTEDELIFMTPLQATQGADTLEIFLPNGTVVNGYVKQRDSQTGIAILSANIHEIEESDLANLVPIPLGNSWSVGQGDLVIAVGGPVGRVHSSMLGAVTYMEKNVRVADGLTRILYTDMQCSSDKGTFLLDKKGQLIGWITEHPDVENDENTEIKYSVAYGISDYKSILEKLTNGIPVPYLGILGQEVTEDMIGGGMPVGVYVVQCQSDSPAYTVGIQNGDIITELNGNPVHTMKEYQLQMEGFQSGQNIVVKVMRNGREEYKEIVFNVTLGNR